MSYKGLMEGWEPEECTGNCGVCDECTQIMETKGDQDYEAWKQEQVDAHFFGQFYE